MFYQNLFQSSNFQIYSIKAFYQLLLYVVINFSIFQIFLQNFLLKKIQLMIEKYFNF